MYKIWLPTFASRMRPASIAMHSARYQQVSDHATRFRSQVRTPPAEACLGYPMTSICIFQVYGAALCCETPENDAPETVRVSPKKGRVVIFYSHHPDGQINPDSQHIGCPVVKGEKWIAQRWLRYEPYNRVNYEKHGWDARFDGAPSEDMMVRQHVQELRQVRHLQGPHVGRSVNDNVPILSKSLATKSTEAPRRPLPLVRGRVRQLGEVGCQDWTLVLLQHESVAAKRTTVRERQHPIAFQQGGSCCGDGIEHCRRSLIECQHRASDIVSGIIGRYGK